MRHKHTLGSTTSWQQMQGKCLTHLWHCPSLWDQKQGCQGGQQEQFTHQTASVLCALLSSTTPLGATDGRCNVETLPNSWFTALFLEVDLRSTTKPHQAPPQGSSSSFPFLMQSPVTWTPWAHLENQTAVSYQQCKTARGQSWARTPREIPRAIESVAEHLANVVEHLLHVLVAFKYYCSAFQRYSISVEDSWMPIQAPGS